MISDGSVGFVVDACPYLQEIHLRPTSITDKSLKHLLRCEFLSRLEFGADSKVSGGAIETYLSAKKKHQLHKIALTKKQGEHFEMRKFPYLKVEVKWGEKQ